jgi:hypothetical protein
MQELLSDVASCDGAGKDTKGLLCDPEVGRNLLKSVGNSADTYSKEVLNGCRAVLNVGEEE